MLIQFSVEGYRSINNEISLKMIPEKSRIMKDHILKDNSSKKVEVLPLALIYGANGSGKSNIVKAIDFSRNLIVNGTRQGEVIEITPFLLGKEQPPKAGKFEFIFKHKEVLYNYGFVVSRKKVIKEWLFACYTSREVKLFERTTNNDRTIVESGDKLINSIEQKGELFLKFIAESTRANQLFLTEACEKNIKILFPPMEWFKKHLLILPSNHKYNNLSIRSYRDGISSYFLSEFLRISDTGIYSISFKKEIFDAEKHLENMSEELKKSIIDNLTLSQNKSSLFFGDTNKMVEFFKENDDNISTFQLKTERKTENGTFLNFDFQDESDGTKKLISLAPAIKNTLEKDIVFVIDDFDKNLHSLLAKYIISTILDNVKTKKNRSQFILTVHDTSLLDRNMVRRDEIWFTEKDDSGATNINSLSKFKISDGLNYENSYLSGRFGGIPHLRNNIKSQI